MKPLLVLKIGTSAITQNGEVNEEIIFKICQQTAILKEKLKVNLIINNNSLTK